MIEFLVIMMLVACSIVNSVAIYRLSQQVAGDNLTIFNKLDATRDGMFGLEHDFNLKLERLNPKKDKNRGKK